MRSKPGFLPSLVVTTTCTLASSAGLANPTDVLRAQAQTASLRQSALRFPVPRDLAAGNETSFACFEDALTTVINAGCFVLPGVPGSGNCTSRASHYFVQYIFPGVTSCNEIVGFGFISNDGQTVFPSAGVVVMPDQQPGLRFPTPTELTNLQVVNIPTPGDTSIVFVDLVSRALTFGPGQAVVLCLRFPEGGTLMGPALGVGPGIAANDSIPDQDCDYFTVNGGGNWFIPDPNDPDPLDWGFELVYRPCTAIEPSSWSEFKGLFSPIAKSIHHEP